MHLLRLLAERGDRARGLIRNPAHAADLEAVGAEPVLCDLEAEHDIARFVTGADAVVFAAGAGPGSGPARKQTVDLGAAVKLIDAAHANGIRRYVMVSGIGVGDLDAVSEEMRPYYEAKAEADRRLEDSGLDYTTVRPGARTNDFPSGRVLAGLGLGRGSIPRADVAATLLAVLDSPETAGVTFDLIAGDTPIDEAVRSLA